MINNNSDKLGIIALYFIRIRKNNEKNIGTVIGTEIIIWYDNLNTTHHVEADLGNKNNRNNTN